GVPLAAFTFAHGGPRIDTPPPTLGQHNAEILGELQQAAEGVGLHGSWAHSRRPLRIPLRGDGTDKPPAPPPPLKKGGRFARAGAWRREGEPGGDHSVRIKDPRPPRCARRPPLFKGRWSKRHCLVSIATPTRLLCPHGLASACVLSVVK